MLATLTLLVLLSPQSERAVESAPGTYRMIDLDRDGRLDRLRIDDAGTLSIALNRGRRQFEPIVQELPRVAVSHVLADDLDGDGQTDLYLVSQGSNVALLGDGSGRFVPDGGELGLLDAGVGVRAERIDVDVDGIPDVLLHNLDGDVVFWGTDASVFERDPLATESVAESTDVAVVAGTPLALPIATVVGGPEAGVPEKVSMGSNRGGATSGTRSSVGATSAPSSMAPGGTLAAGGGGLSPTVEEVVQIPFPPCASGVTDVTSGICLTADSVPGLGTLYPLGMEFNILPTGEVGMGTTSPVADLHVAGSLFSELRISPNTSTLNQGGADIFLSEGLTINCGWRLSYDGVLDNAFKIISECTTPETRMAIDRTAGTVLIGGDDFSTSITGPGRVRVNGDVSQSLTGDGLVKAGVHVDGSVPSISRSFNNLPGGSGVVVSRLGTGLFEIDFGADVSNRFYIGTIGGATPINATDATIEVSPRSGNANAVFIEIDDENGISVDSDFFVAIF